VREIDVPHPPVAERLNEAVLIKLLRGGPFPLHCHVRSTLPERLAPTRDIVELKLRDKGP
jgi:hypothetical protein